MLVIVALVISGFLSNAAIEELNNYFSFIALRLEFGLRELGFVTVFGIVTIALAVIYPATILSKVKPVRGLKGRNSTSGGEGLFVRRFLTTFQFCIVQIFILAAVIVGLQLNHFRNYELGFSASAIVSVAIPDQIKSEVFRSTVMQQQDVAEVTFGSGPPMAVKWITARYNISITASIYGRESEC